MVIGVFKTRFEDFVIHTDAFSLALRAVHVMRCDVMRCDVM